MIFRVPRWLTIVALLLPGSIGPRFAYAAPENADAALVQRALAAELDSVRDRQHPMRYRLHKISPRLSTTKEIVETKDGAVARLVAINEKPLSPADEQKEEARLDALLSDPGKQRHRKQAEQDDTSRVLKVLRALPKAFLYERIGSDEGAHGQIEKFTFRPNPTFDAPDLETQALTEMTGEIWIDAAESRVVRLEGHLQQDVDFGWGLLGRVYKGGWIVIEQAVVTNHQWRIVHFQMVMSGRVFFKTRSFDTREDQTGFAPVPADINYTQAIRMLRESPTLASAR
jgi:hypothetical protein